MKSKKFESLLPSEIKKAEAAANKATGTKNCKVTGYSWTRSSLGIDPDAMFVDVRCEICHDYEQRADVDVLLSIPMFDRRRSFATAVSNH